MQTTKRAIVGTVLVAIIVGLGIFLARYAGSNFGGGGNSADFPEGTFWRCAENGHQFNMSIAELGRWYEEHPNESPPCPKCDSRKTMRIEKGSTNATGVADRYSR